MRAVTRLGDLSTGHGCFPPQIALSGSFNVFVNGRPVVKTGSSWSPHTCVDATHPGTQVLGSLSVLVNGVPMARIGDFISCGSFCATGSTNVFAGG